LEPSVTATSTQLDWPPLRRLLDHAAAGMSALLTVLAPYCLQSVRITEDAALYAMQLFISRAH
jgi:hypothetical protein